MNSEHRRYINDCFDELDKIKNWIDKNRLDTNVKFLVAYAVVKASGTIEIVFKSILHEFLSEGCKEETRYFIEKNVVDNSCNPSVDNIKNLLDRVDSDRSKSFVELTKGTRQKGDLSSLVKLRNDLAHGRDINTSIIEVKRYYEWNMSFAEEGYKEE